MKTKSILVIILLMLLVQLQASAQKGVIAKYKTDNLYICFMHIQTGKMLKDPVVIGRDVTVQHNISFEKIALTYTSSDDGQPHHLILSYVRDEKEGNNGVIMEDEEGNPTTVYNELKTNGGLSIIKHGVNSDGYLTMVLLEDAKKVY